MAGRKSIDDPILPYCDEANLPASLGGRSAKKYYWVHFRCWPAWFGKIKKTHQNIKTPRSRDAPSAAGSRRDTPSSATRPSTRQPVWAFGYLYPVPPTSSPRR